MAHNNSGAIRKLFHLLRYEQKEILSIYFYAILAGLVQLSLPLGIQSIVSFVQATAISTSLVLLIIAVIVGVGVVGLLRVKVMAIIEKIQQQLFVRYAFAYADTMPRLDLQALDGNYLPELTNRFFDTTTLQKGIGKLLLDFPTATIQILFGLLLLSFYHAAFIFFGILLIVVLLLLFRITGAAGMQTSIEESDYKYKVAGFLEEMARVITSFKFTRHTALHLHRTDNYVTGYLSARTRHFRILKWQYWALIVFKLLITAAMLIIGAVLLVNQLLSIGQFIAAEIVILTVISSVEKMIVNLDNVYDVLTSVEKITKLTDKPQEVEGSGNLKPGTNGFSITANEISFGFSPAEPILKNVSFRIESGEKIALMGSFGSGKSTLLRLMSGLHPQFGGALSINGIPIGMYNRQELRGEIGILLQHMTDIFAGTLHENIAMGRDISIHTLHELSGIVGLQPFIESTPMGYDMLLQPAGQGLSGKTIRKIMLMRALIHRPRLLLLEEPCLGLDEPAAMRIRDYLLSLSNSTAVIVTTDTEFASRCSRIFTLNNAGLQIQ